jgi:hypothetical protein
MRALEKDFEIRSWLNKKAVNLGNSEKKYATGIGKS